MTLHALRNLRTGELVAERVAKAETFLSRGLGLLPRKQVAPDEGLWIRGCSSVHTMGMRATIDLYFLDADDRVLRIVRRARPNRPLFACLRAQSVVELGWAQDVTPEVQVGDRLALE